MCTLPAAFFWFRESTSFENEQLKKPYFKTFAEVLICNLLRKNMVLTSKDGGCKDNLHRRLKLNV